MSRKDIRDVFDKCREQGYIKSFYIKIVDGEVIKVECKACDTCNFFNK